MFPAPGQADFEQQRHLRCWQKIFKKCGMKKIFEKFLQKLLISHRCHIKRLQSGKKLNFVDAKNFRLQMIKSCHPRYLEVSLGSKEHIFEEFHFFIRFCAFLRPKRPASKNPKNS